MAGRNNTGDFGKKLICVQYPGIVQNAGEAVKTLGGIDTISKFIASKNRRLEVRFRPDDPYCKPAFASKHSVNAALVKVIVDVDSDDEENYRVVSADVVGTVESIHKFETLSDFQYLPMQTSQKSEQESSKCILDDLVPKGIPGLNWFDGAKDYFLVPPLFSRIDTPQNYNLHAVPGDNRKSDPNVIGTARKKRHSLAWYLTFDHMEPIPTEPKKKAEAFLRNVSPEAFERIKQLFQEQPIWSRIGLVSVTKMSWPTLKYILPNVAYYYTSGPWRVMWIRFGYDPRKETASRIYQHVDFRIRNIGNFKNLIKCTRYSSKPIIPKSSNAARNDLSFSQVELKSDDQPPDDLHIFMPGKLPAHFQTFFQYCNIRVPEIEEAISKLGEVLPGALCHEKRGWMPPEFEETCREIMNKYIVDKMRELTMEKLSKGESSNASTDMEIDERPSDVSEVGVLPIEYDPETDYD